jgi:hypothetical protein
MKKLALGLVLSVSCIASAADEWIPVYRTAIVVDAFQTAESRGSHGKWREMNPMYASMGDGEAFAAVLLTGYAIERAITGIKHKPTRNFVGWIASGIEIDCVRGNARLGLGVRF